MHGRAIERKCAIRNWCCLTPTTPRPRPCPLRSPSAPRHRCVTGPQQRSSRGKEYDRLKKSSWKRTAYGKGRGHRRALYRTGWPAAVARAARSGSACRQPTAPSRRRAAGRRPSTQPVGRPQRPRPRKSRLGGMVRFRGCRGNRHGKGWQSAVAGVGVPHALHEEHPRAHACVRQAHTHAEVRHAHVCMHAHTTIKPQAWIPRLQHWL